MENYTGFKDYYKILGVDRNASEEEIKKVYRALAKKYHPDANRDKSPEEYQEIEKKMQLINDAYDVIGNESKNNKRAEYNIIYDQYYADLRAREAERQRQSQQRQRQSQQRQQHSQQRTTSRTHKARTVEEPEENGFKKAMGDIRTAWKEVRAEEKKMPFLKRHRKINGEIYRNMYKENGNGFDDFVYILKNGSLHVVMEALWQLEKLTHITEDSVPKYVIRNRVLAYTLALIMVFSGALATQQNDGPVVDDKPSFSQQTPEADKDVTIEDGTYQEEQQKQQEAKENRDYVVIRKYTIQPDDMLSVLAVNANTSIESIMALNDISSPDLIKYGETLYIPYVVEGEDLKYATVAAYFKPGTNVEEFANRYGTDAASIYALNEEAFENGQVISDTLLVPTWASQSEIKTQKEAKTYTYSNNQ